MRDPGSISRKGSRPTDFERLLREWDSIFLQTVDPTRSRRMEAILDVLGSRLQQPIRVLDLGTGPGPLAERMLQRFPGGRVVGVDSDPVLLHVCQQALSRYGNRVSLVLADLKSESWSTGLPAEGFDAAVSSLALHWLDESELRSLYRELRRLLRPGGLLVNGDWLPSDRTKEAPRDPAASSGGRQRAPKEPASVAAFKLAWKDWWSGLERDSSMRSAFRERKVRMPGPIPPRRTTGPRVPVTVESHKRGLRAAGFRGTAVTWRNHDFRVLVGTN